MSTELFPSPDRPPYALPLERAEFARALSLGYGRARQHASAYCLAGSAEILVGAAIQDGGSDGAPDHDRAEWTLGLIESAGMIDVLAPVLIRVAMEPVVGDWPYGDQVDRAGVMAGLARRGYPAGRDALYALLTPPCEPELMPAAARDIIDLDGASGLIHVCEWIAERLGTPSEVRVDKQLLRHFDGSRESGAALRLLKSLRATNARIAAFLDALQRQQGSRPSGGETGRVPGWHSTMNAEDVMKWMREAPAEEDDMWLGWWGRKAGEHELRPLRAALESAEDLLLKARLLGVFTGRQMPDVTDHVVGLCKHPDRRLRVRARHALSQVRDDRIRQMAFHLLRTDSLADGPLDLLQSNYRSGDHAVIESKVRLSDDYDESHGVVSELGQLFERHPLPECQRLLLFAYEHSPCGICRRRAVRVMEQVGVLPQWVAEECRFDSD